MTTVLGIVLVLLSWAALVALVVLLGLAAAVAAGRGAARDILMRSSLWWGLGVLVLLASGVSLVTPLRTPQAAWMVAGSAVILGVVGVALWRRVTSARPSRWRRPSGADLALLLALLACVVYLGARALGTVTNYDSGLYHLTAIAYVGDYGTVPGLANLHFPLGYANSLFPFAALLGNGPWDGVGYRLANGLIVVLVCLDLALRLLARRWSWGTWLLVAAAASIFVPMIALADFWVTSPTSDTTVLLLTVVSAAYLADAVSLRRTGPAAGSVVGVLAVLTVTMRPTMIAFALTALIVLVIVAVRRRRVHPPLTRMGWTLVVAFGIVAFVVEVLRDQRLSGWLLYPLSVLPLGPAWQAADPVGVREATLSAARDPSRADHGIVAHSWSWIPGWVERAATQWETWFLAVGLLVLVVLILLLRSAGGSMPWRRVLLVMAPSAVAAAAWFLASPPSYRFGWGPLFTLVLIPIGATLHGLARSGRWSSLIRRGLPVAVAAVLVLICGYSALARTPWTAQTEERSFTLAGVSVPYQVAPIPLPPVEDVTTTSGLALVRPTESDQCWGRYPLCSPMAEPGLALRGPDLADGFVR